MRKLFLAMLLTISLLLLSNAADAGGKGTVVELGKLKSETPASWKQQTPSSNLRTHQFAVGDAELTIFYFQGGGGSVKDNIQRWKSQFLPPEGKSIDDVTKIETIKLPKAELTYVDIQGTYLSKNPPNSPNAKTERKSAYRRLMVYFATEGGPYFISLTGPSKTIEQNKKSFDEWLKNFK